jgi:hypothetical protein
MDGVLADGEAALGAGAGAPAAADGQP